MRGAAIRLILDPNEVAFGNGKIGIPNRPVAQELADKSDGSIQIRWYNTDKEQYHVKAMLIAGPEGAVIHNGSANFTARNLDDLNLESNLRITAPSGSRAAMDAEAYFQRLWSNEDAPYTVEYGQYENDTVWIKRVLYRVQDLLGFTTF
ncbi:MULTISPECIES: phospholipase D-like domain-containing protein [unclassified Paenibacillus]|uniref:phospholipase D-like domain-containing protein n=1 Tax=unclassified Paenibacillus TaxID=185978 RepID=UPI001F36B2A6|nr:MULTISPECIES: phospholipase D-like domain-containing protein [unclassified Paenibacillus]